MNLKNIKLRRLIAFVLSIALLLTALPFESLVEAAGDPVTVTITDSKGQPVKDATIDYEIYSNEKIEDTSVPTTPITLYQANVKVSGGSVTTDDQGKATLMPSLYFLSGKYRIIYVVKADLHNNASSSGDSSVASLSELDPMNPAHCEGLTNPMSISMESFPEIQGLTITGVNMDFVEAGGQEIPAFEMTRELLADESMSFTILDSNGAEVTPSKTVDDIPYVNQYGNYTVKVTVTKNGHQPLEKTVNSSLSKANMGQVQVKLFPGDGNKVTNADGSVSIAFDGSLHQTVAVTGFPKGATVRYRTTINGTTSDYSTTVPTVKNVGKVELEIDISQPGYENYNKKFTLEVVKGNLVQTFPATVGRYYFNNQAQDILRSLENLQPGDKIIYTIKDLDRPESATNPLTNDGENPTPISIDQFPKIKDAGRYEIDLRVLRDGYNDVPAIWQEPYYQNYDVNNEIQAKQEVEYGKKQVAYILPLAQELKFTNYPDKSIAGFPYVNTAGTDKNDYDFTAELVRNDANRTYNPTITYKYESMNDPYIELDQLIQPVNGTATSEELANGISTGKVRFLQPGGLKVTAVITEPDGSNYKSTEVSMTVYLTMADNGTVEVNKSEYIRFGAKTKIYILSKSNRVSNLQIEPKNPDHTRFKGAAKEYRILDPATGAEIKDIGISINRSTGEILVSDYQKLTETLFAIENDPTIQDKSLKLFVQGSLTGDKVKIPNVPGKLSLQDTVQYELIIKFGQKPSEASGKGYTLQPEPTGEWTINSNPIAVHALTDADTGSYLYKVGRRGANPTSFGNSTTFSGSMTEAWIQFMNTAGHISAPVLVDEIKIDLEDPKATDIRYSIDLYQGSDLLSSDVGIWDPFTLFYNALIQDPKTLKTAVITFYATDRVSGVKSFHYTFTPGEGSGSDEAVQTSGTVPAQRFTGTDDYYGTISLPIKDLNNIIQNNGSLSFEAEDIAGRKSAVYDDVNRVQVIVDSVKPDLTFNYYGDLNLEYAGAAKDDNVIYSKSPIVAELAMKEANFEFNREEIKVQLLKDSEEATFDPLEWLKTAHDEEAATVKAGEDIEFATIDLKEDGEYQLIVDHEDRSQNRMGEVKSKLLIVDTYRPEYNIIVNEDQSTTFIFREKNFVKEDIIATVTAEDSAGEPIEEINDLQEVLRTGDWQTEDGETYTLTVDDFVDGNYNIAIEYTDPAGNKALDRPDLSVTFDKTAPTEVDIFFSKEITPSQIGEYFYRFYGAVPAATIRFEASDAVSGITDFEWRYVKQAGASSVNVDTTEIEWLKADRVSGSAKSTAEIMLPAEMDGQYRGYIEVRAVDRMGNVREEYSVFDLQPFVIDSIAPQGTVDYGSHDRKFNDVYYYSKPITATYTIDEANFFAEDIYLFLSKDGADRERVNLEWTDEGDKHTASYTIPDDGIYQLTMEYTDRSGNVMETLSSAKLIIDQKAPVIEVVYDNNDVKNTLPDWAGHSRQYFDRQRTATIRITERNFNAEDVDFVFVANDVSGNALDIGNLMTPTAWSTNGDVHTMTVTYPGDANYTFDIDYADLAGNQANDYPTDYFTVDKTAPTNLTVDYKGSITQSAGGTNYYNDMVTVTISATDVTSGIHNFEYSYINAGYVSAVNAQLLNQLLSEAEISYSNGGSTATAVFTVPRSALGPGNQFNGNVEFFARDRSLNSSELRDGQRLVIDNISPVGNVTYNEPSFAEGGTRYYKDDIVATITIDEANFDPTDVQLLLTKDGVTRSVQADWSSPTADKHIGKLVIHGDGLYQLEVSYVDKSNNAMVTYRSGDMLIDTKIEKPVISINGKDGKGQAFRNGVILKIVMKDENFDSYTVKLTRTRNGVINEDVTETFMNSTFTRTKDGYEASFDTFEKIRENDGIYTLTVTVRDKAGNEAVETVVFSVNRFGSVYTYDKYLSDLISDGGRAVKVLDKDITVLEFNPDQIDKGQVKVSITRDGKPLDKVIFSFEPVKNTKKGIGESGWYEYKYVISKDNFKEDGIYKVTISSVDAAGNTPENSLQNQEIVFIVDNTAPEITSITGLEKAVINASEQEVTFTVFDALGLKSIKIYVNGELLEEITEFEDINNYTGSFMLYEQDDIQSVRIVVEDRAGNITDTDSEHFTSAYAFNSHVTLSTNLFVRMQADPPLLWGFIAALVALILLTLFFILFKRRKSEEEEENADQTA